MKNPVVFLVALLLSSPPFVAAAVGTAAVVVAGWGLRLRARIALIALAVLGSAALPDTISRLVPSGVVALEGPPQDFLWLRKDPASGALEVVPYAPALAVAARDAGASCARTLPPSVVLAPRGSNRPYEHVSLEADANVMTLDLTYDAWDVGRFEYACNSAGVFPLRAKTEWFTYGYGERFRVSIIAAWAALLVIARLVLLLPAVPRRFRRPSS